MVDLMTHLDYETLLDYLEGRSSVEERGKVDMHLAEPCASCSRRIALLQKVLNSANGDRSVVPPQSVLKRAIDIPRHATSPRPGLLTRLIATLSFDSDLQLSSALTRGPARERQVLFNTEEVDIDVKIKPGLADYDLLGQVMGVDATFGFASLQDTTGQLIDVTGMDFLGQFSFRRVPAGIYDLVFDLEDQQITVNGLKVGYE
jgi:hypothetical protein